jgi:hypothetical protein
MGSLGTRVPVRERHPEGGSEQCCGSGFEGHAEALNRHVGFRALVFECSNREFFLRLKPFLVEASRGCEVGTASALSCG